MKVLKKLQIKANCWIYRALVIVSIVGGCVQERRLQQLSDPLRRVTDSPVAYIPVCTQLPLLGQDTASATSSGAAAGESPPVPLHRPLEKHVTVRDHARPFLTKGACQQVSRVLYLQICQRPCPCLGRWPFDLSLGQSGALNQKTLVSPLTLLLNCPRLKRLKWSVV